MRMHVLEVSNFRDRLRKDRFERLATSLRATDRQAQESKTDGKVLSDAYSMLRKEYQLGSEHLKSSAQLMAKSLQPEQILYFQNKVDKEIAEDRAESYENKNRELVSKYRKIFKFFAGELTPEQRAKLVGQFMEDYDSLCTPEYSQAMTNYENEFKDFLNKFWTTMSSGQKVQLHLHLEDQAREPERLARGP